MTNDRPYKRAMSHEDAVRELRRQAGTQFDPELVGLFCDLFADAPPLPDASVTAMNAHARRLGAARRAGGVLRPRRSCPSTPGRAGRGAGSAETARTAPGKSSNLTRARRQLTRVVELAASPSGRGCAAGILRRVSSPDPAPGRDRHRS